MAASRHVSRAEAPFGTTAWNGYEGERGRPASNRHTLQKRILSHALG